MTARTASSKNTAKRFFIYSHDDYDTSLMTLEEAKKEVSENFDGYANDEDGARLIIFEAKFEAKRNSVEFKPV